MEIPSLAVPVFLGPVRLRARTSQRNADERTARVVLKSERDVRRRAKARSGRNPRSEGPQPPPPGHLRHRRRPAPIPPSRPPGPTLLASPRAEANRSSRLPHNGVLRKQIGKSLTRGSGIQSTDSLAINVSGGQWCLSLVKCSTEHGEKGIDRRRLLDDV